MTHGRQTHNDIADLADAGKGEQLFGVFLKNGEQRGKKRRECADPADDRIQRQRRNFRRANVNKENDKTKDARF